LFYWNLDDKIKKVNKQNLKDSLDEQIFIDDITWKKYMDKQNSIADILLKDNKTTLEQVKKLIVNTKLDLITGVVREFPELQGIIGRYYFGYEINPYIYDNNAIDLDILYYYFIDRIAYIQVMFQQGKQPTGSGDKYKVKNRMDDIVKAVVKLSNTVEISKLLVLIKANNEIYKLFQKRYQKYTEAELSEENKDIVKVIADSCIKALSYDRIYTEVKTFAKNLQNTAFVKTYKRLNGYTNDCRLKITNETDEEIYKYINDILGINYKQNQNINILENEKIINNINNFLDNTKISENEILKKALVIIQKTLFEKQLPIEMI
jgi:glycyl-tRNA synthetase beta chain